MRELPLQWKDPKARKWILDHWKIAIHLVLHTNRFGVNNDWWFNYYESLFGYRPWWRTLLNIISVKPMIKNYRAMKHRAIYLGFMHPDEVKLLWGRHPWFG